MNVKQIESITTLEMLDMTIDHAVLIRAEPERIYDAFTTGEGLDGWFTAGSTVDRRPGGTMHWRWQDWGPDKTTAEGSGPILEVERPTRFAFRWQWGQPGDLSTVEVDFTPTAEGTVVHLRNVDYPDTPAGRKGIMECAAGWGEALALLKFWVEHGIRY